MNTPNRIAMAAALHGRYVATSMIFVVGLLTSACAASTPVPTPVATATAAPIASASPPATTAPTPTATAVPSPSPCALPVTSSGPVALPPGPCTAAGPFPLRLTFTVPAGWAGNIGGPYLVLLAQATGPAGLAFSVDTKLYADPCHTDKGFLNPPPGSSVDALATALARLPGLTATTPTAVTLGGYQGKQLTLTAPASATGCTDGDYSVWQLPLGAINALTPGELDRVWVLDVAGQRLVVDAAETPDQTTADIAEVQGVLDFLQLAPGH